MSVSMNIRQVGDVVIIDSVGRITLAGGAGALRETIRGLASEGRKKVILNLAETSYVDSSGFGEMIAGFTRLSNLGASLKLLALNKRVKDLLQITKLYTCFEIFEDEASAIRSFGDR